MGVVDGGSEVRLATGLRGTQNLIQTTTTTRSKDRSSDDRVGFIMVKMSWMKERPLRRHENAMHP